MAFHANLLRTLYLHFEILKHQHFEFRGRDFIEAQNGPFHAILRLIVPPYANLDEDQATLPPPNPGTKISLQYLRVYPHF